MRRNPERLAWAALIASFFACCALAVGVPATAVSIVNSATTDAAVTVKLQSGRMVTYGPRESEANARVVDNVGRAVEEGTTIVVDPDSQGQLVIATADGTRPLLSAQLYSGARMEISRARLPRFAESAAPDDILLSLLAGRASISAQPTAQRDARIEIRSDFARSMLDRGSYSFEALPQETRVATRDGRAVVHETAKTATGPTLNALVLPAGQRTVARAEAGLLDPQEPGVNLVQNSNFAEPLDPPWKTFAERASESDPYGTVQSINTGSETALLIDRFGQGLNWGRTGVQQDLNVNVSGRSSLQLRTVFSILYQELPVCGFQGSECPLFISIGYRDTSGGEHEWTQGFYADGTASTTSVPPYPDEIKTAPEPRTKHAKKGLGVRETYESDNLLKFLPDVATIRYVKVYAEGHGLRTLVYSTELIAQD